MSWRKFLAAFLSFVAVSPVWGGAEPLGNITFSNDATVRHTQLAPGSTVFSGDVISVSERGAARIALVGGAQAEILNNSSVQINKTADSVQMAVEGGRVSFHAAGESTFSALINGATVRPVGGTETSGVIQLLSDTHAFVAAQKGTLLLTTAADGKTYTLQEGQAADLTATEDPQQGGAPPAPAGKSSFPTISKKTVYWTVAIVAAAVGVTSYLLVRHEHKIPASNLQNEISPHTLN